MKNSFGDKFLGEITLKIDPGEEPQVSIGLKEDYIQLQVNRQRIIDELKIDKIIDKGDNIRIIRIVSDRPLFFPSLNLVIKAKQNGGALIENFLITVDFQKNVFLGVPRHKAPSSISKEEALQKTESTASQINPLPKKNDSQDLLVFENSSDSLEKESEKALRSVPEQQLKSGPIEGLSSQETELEKQESDSIKPSQAQSPIGKTQTFDSVKVLERPPQAPPERKTGQFFGPLEKGQTLYDVIKQLNLGEYRKFRVMAAIWLDNWEQFIFGNIHGVKKGAFLNLSRLADRLTQLSSEAALLIIKNHWKEWKIIRKKLASPLNNSVHKTFKTQRDTPYNPIFQSIWNKNIHVGSGESQKGSTKIKRISLSLDFIPYKKRLLDFLKTMNLGGLANGAPKAFSGHGALEKSLSYERPLPSEINLEKVGVLRSLEEWRKKWEKGDLAGFIGLYSNRFKEEREDGSILKLAEWKRLKKDIMTFHPQSRMVLFSPKLVNHNNHLLTSFEQNFVSDTLNVFGHKYLEWEKEQGNWKIISEKFWIKPVDTQNQSAPFAIHVSSHSDYRSAQMKINSLRDKGFDGFISSLSLRNDKLIYRTLVGRFSSWRLADEMAKEIRKYKLGGFAIPAPIPYVLRMGTFPDEKNAADQIERFRRRGLSAFLYSTLDESGNALFQVFVGAFTEREGAKGIREALKVADLPFEFVAP